MSERDPELERLFRAARREEEPTDDDRRAVRGSIAARLAVAAAAGSAATLVPRAAAAGAGVGKATILGWFAAGLGAGATLGAIVTATVVLREKDERPVVVPSAVVTASTPEPPVAPPRAAPEPASEPTVTTTPPPSRPTSSVPEVASATPSLELETRALGEATRAFRDGRPEEALRLLAEQDRTFARGSLQEERAATRVFALCAAGRLAATRAARARFLIDYPQSPSADRVRASCPP